MKYWMLLLLLAVALGANGQTFVEVDSVEISLGGISCQGAPNDVFVVIVGTSESVQASRQGNRWVGRPALPLRIDLKTVRAYVLFEKHRTGYQKTKNYARHKLSLDFQTCITERVRDLEVKAADKATESIDLTVRYQRSLDGATTDTNLDETNTIPAVWFAKETLNLQLAWSEKRAKVPGLVVTSKNGAEKPLFVVSVAPGGDRIVPNLSLWTHPEKGLSVRDILRVIDRQQSGHSGSRWLNSSARRTEEARLTEARLNTVYLTPK